MASGRSCRAADPSSLSWWPPSPPAGSAEGAAVRRDRHGWRRRQGTIGASWARELSVLREFSCEWRRRSLSPCTSRLITMRSTSIFATLTSMIPTSYTTCTRGCAKAEVSSTPDRFNQLPELKQRLDGHWEAIGYEICDHIVHDWEHFSSNDVPDPRSMDHVCRDSEYLPRPQVKRAAVREIYFQDAFHHQEALVGMRMLMPTNSPASPPVAHNDC